MLDAVEFGKCNKCEMDAITEVADVPLCPFHFIEQEDDECLRAYLCHRIDKIGRIDEPKEVQLEIKKQKPKIYESLKPYFDV